MKTKIFATLGPSLHSRQMLEEAISLGVDGFRINLSHGNLDDFKEWFFNLNEVKKDDTEIIIDMQGPELRLGTFDDDVALCKGNAYPLSILNIEQKIADHFTAGNNVFFDDGKIGIRIIDDDNFVSLNDGVVKSRKSIKIDNCQRFLPILTDRDLYNIGVAKEYGITGIMCPFIESEKDILELKQCLNDNNCNLKIYSKIESVEGFGNLNEIAINSDVVVVARGDLGNAFGLARLPYIQRKITDYCLENHKEFMVVTQMLDSMINNPYPTRAEVSDIFYAVISGADYVMLTGESASGKYPLESLKMMVDVVKEADKYLKEC